MKIPTGWSKVRLGDKCNTFSGGTPSRGNPNFFGPGIPWIKSGELNDGEIFSTEESLTDEGIKQSATQIVAPGTNLIALYGATAGVVGRARIRAAINQAILAVIPNDGDIVPDFLQFLLQRVGFETAKLSQGAQPNLNAGIIQDRIILLPPSNEQLRIAVVLQTWTDSIRKAEKHLTLTENLRRGLMQQLLTGAIRVPMEE